MAPPIPQRGGDAFTAGPVYCRPRSSFRTSCISSAGRSARWRRFTRRCSTDWRPAAATARPSGRRWSRAPRPCGAQPRKSRPCSTASRQRCFPRLGPIAATAFSRGPSRHRRSRRGSMSGSPRRARGRSSSFCACCCRCSPPRRRKLTPAPKPTPISPRSATSTPCANSAAPAASSRTKSWRSSRATATNDGALSRRTNPSRTVACEKSWS